MQFHQTRSHAVVLYNTQPAACIEKAVYENYGRTLPEGTLNSMSTTSCVKIDARSSWEPSSDSKSYGEICNNTVDYRISGVLLSAVEQQNTTRENKVKKLIEKFENHEHKESLSIRT